MDEALQRHLAETNLLADAPSVRLIRFARLELADMLTCGRQAVAQLVGAAARAAMRDWLKLLDDCLAAAGGLAGSGERSPPARAKRYSAKPYTFAPVPKRDERWQDLWNQAVNPEALLYDPDLPVRPKTLMMYFIEQGLMSKTGKRYEWEVGTQSGDPLSGVFQDYDWADEVLHARIGRDWYIPAVGDPARAIAYGDQCWSRVLSNWRKVLEDGLTRHENWWPDVYREACAHWGVEPDPKVLAYNTTYEDTHADLKNVSVSG